jgi:predicted phage terminase large subunit-like protein
MVEWFTGTIMQLREPDTKIVVVGTLKTNKQDIYNIVLNSPVWSTFKTGAILSHELGSIEYDVIRTGEAGTVTGVTVRTPGVVTLWPQKWTIEALLIEMLASLDRAVWIREKLNDLRALAGKIFKRDELDYFTDEDLAAIQAGGGFERVIQIWDTAYEESKAADFSVCVTAGLYKFKVYVLDVYRAKLELPALRRAIESQYAIWQPEIIGIEDIGSGKSVLQVLEKETGLPLMRVDPEGRDKVARARGTTVYVEAGRILLRSGALWLTAFLNELTMFPDDEHDDQVDAFVYMVLVLLLGKGKKRKARAR